MSQCIIPVCIVTLNSRIVTLNVILNSQIHGLLDIVA